MSVISAAAELGEVLSEILKQEESVLFAGAGVAARAGLPVWEGYLEYLAKVVEPRQPLIAQLIRTRVNEKSLLLAAHYYKTCTEIPKGERYQKLAEPFQADKYDHKRLKALISLPFTSVVTTNYDRSLHDAFATVYGKTAVQVELGDPSLQSALFCTVPFIARIHGRAEVPLSIVLDSDDYKALYADDAYIDFLHGVFMQRRCVFIGFSFVDPAIAKILEFIAARGVFPKKHFAIVPSGAVELTEKLSEQNIELLLYDPSENHKVLWEGFERARALIAGQPAVSTTHLVPTFEVAKRLIAVCYARARMGEEGLALKNLIIQGILISEISSGVTAVAELPRKLQRYIALKPEEATSLVSSALDALVAKKLCLCDGTEAVIVNNLSDFAALSPASHIAGAIIDRLMVREQYEVKPEIRTALEHVVEDVLVQRGFDLGAEFAGERYSTELDPGSTIRQSVDRHLPQHWQHRKSQITAAFLDMIRRPTASEEKLLASAGRISFGIEIVLQAGRTTIYSASLPEVVYLDASVVLPAIVPGHPYQQAYIQSLAKLQQACEAEGSSSTVLVADVFLNEIVTHRKLAISFVEDFALEDRDTLTRRVQYFGADNVNVFVGAYSSWIANGHEGTFAEFLSEVAPYSDEYELAEFLREKGIRVGSTKRRGPADVKLYEGIKDRVIDGYDRAEFGFEDGDRKALVLKKHEAAQVTVLLEAIKEGRRAILVTADKSLRRVVAGLRIRELKDTLISHRNLVQLIDLLVGVPIEQASLSRLLWTVRIADDASAIKDYLIARALPQYDAALTLAMSDMLDGAVDRIIREAKLEDVKFGSGAAEERAKELKFLDRVEGEVFAQLAQEVKKLKEVLKPGKTSKS
jgi:hypothetical protein